MTEKRFIEYCTNLEDIKNGEALIPNFGVKDNVTGETINSAKRNLEMLNALHEENQELKGEIGKILEVNEDFLEEKRQWEKMSDAFAELYEEYQKLRKALKKEYMSMSGVLCDACKHQEATYTNNWFVGEDFDVKCNKGYEVLIDDDEQECDDFELRIGDVE